MISGSSDYTMIKVLPLNSPEVATLHAALQTDSELKGIFKETTDSQTKRTMIFVLTHFFYPQMQNKKMDEIVAELKEKLMSKSLGKGKPLPLKGAPISQHVEERKGTPEFKKSADQKDTRIGPTGKIPEHGSFKNPNKDSTTH